MFDPFYLLVAVVFLSIITVLVAAHELGHYLFARMFGMGVEDFAIGFGKKPSWPWAKRRYRVDPTEETKPADPSDDAAQKPVEPAPAYETTAFTVRPWPLGGFVRIKGMTPEEDGSEIHIPGGFYSKAPWQRFVVLLMGPVFSVLAGIALLIPLFMIVGVQRFANEPIVGWIKVGGGADLAQLKPGDRILEVNGQKVSTFYDVIVQMRKTGTKPLAFRVRRYGGIMETTVTPKLSEEPVPVIGPNLEQSSEKRIQPMLGIGYDQKKVKVKLSFAEAIAETVAMPGKMVASLAGIFMQPSRFKEELGGPVTMVALTAGTTRQGLDQVIYLAGVLSISLGIFNLLPISPLDGGQMVVAFAEVLRRGRRLSFRMQNWVAGVGVLLIFALVLGVLAADISRFFPGKNDEKSVQMRTK